MRPSEQLKQVKKLSTDFYNGYLSQEEYLAKRRALLELLEKKFNNHN